jgi:hypothetical protein
MEILNEAKAPVQKTMDQNKVHTKYHQCSNPAATFLTYVSPNKWNLTTIVNEKNNILIQT